jgi:hypothetical protein
MAVAVERLEKARSWVVRCEEAIGDEVTMRPTLGSPGDGRR